jgi:hypothetical protein
MAFLQYCAPVHSNASAHRRTDMLRTPDRGRCRIDGPAGARSRAADCRSATRFAVDTADADRLKIPAIPVVFARSRRRIRLHLSRAMRNRLEKTGFSALKPCNALSLCWIPA